MLKPKPIPFEMNISESNIDIYVIKFMHDSGRFHVIFILSLELNVWNRDMRDSKLSSFGI